jgi:Calcium-dependent channel, 7TM region, putative phosphate/Late exocytosis, associated with Golgi transport
MATLQQIGSTFLFGSCVFTISLSLFGCAVRNRSTFIAPRAEARPHQVIFPESSPTPQWWCICAQSTLGWIPWTLSLSYDTLLHGIPGTGTRQEGRAGSLLHVNLDGIVLLRFVAMCLRVCCLAALLLVFFGIPIYLSAQCYAPQGDDDISYSTTCDSTSYNLTNFERTTIYNVPTIELKNPIHTVVHANNGILWRLYSIVFCFWILVFYLCHLLHSEWVEILAMRRVYFFEHDVWGARRAELKQTLMYEELAEAKRQQLLQEQQHKNNEQQHKATKAVEEKSAFSFDTSPTKTSKRKRINVLFPFQKSASTPTLDAEGLIHPEPHLIQREPWIPHPEQRDTVPNIAIYSVLVGGLPSLPEQAADSFNSEATIQFSQRESIDWQLSLATTFFDHCVPNQPGFSSSIAAITIVPGAMDLSVAWRKWYTAAAKLRRLRFIRKHIELRRHYEIESQQTSSGDIKKQEGNPVEQYGYGETIDYGYETNDQDRGFEVSNVDETDDVFVPIDAKQEEITSYLAHAPPKPNPNWIDRETTPRGIYGAHKNNQLYFRQVLGSTMEIDKDTHIYDSLEFGPEQASVYAREFAQSAAPCCPNGCNEGYIQRAPIDELVDMERIVAVQVHQANLELRDARFRALRTDGQNALNIHDQQRGQAPNQNTAVAPTVAGTNAVSPHTINLAASSTRLLPPTVKEDEENDDDDDNILDMLPANAVLQPMASRYDRRASANDDNNNAKAAVVDRLNTSRLGEIAASKKGDLDLEAQLFQKSVVGDAQKPMVSRYDRRASANDDTNQKVAPAVVDRLDPSRVGDIAASKKGDLDLEAQLFRKSVDDAKRSVKAKPPLPPNKSDSVELDHQAHRRNASLIGQFLSDIEPDSESTDYTGNISSKPPMRLDTLLSQRKPSLRKRNPHSSDNSSSAQWAQVETYISEARKTDQSTGWHLPNLRWLVRRTKEHSKIIGKWAKKQSKVAVNSLARESSYAVITFTSRQAAVAARACLADGRGANRWMTLKEIPIPPLADAAPFDFITFRNCCRPVTLSINERQKNFRNYLSLIFLGFFFVFYTVPLTLASQLVNPEAVNKLFPKFVGSVVQKGGGLSGLITALIWSSFFALCPVIFKSIAHFGSKATSVASAEFKALQYFWWFMVVTAFSGQLLATMGLKAFNEGISLDSELQSILRQIAGSIPTTVAVSWLNWIIFRFTITLPLNYMLQINTFIFHFLGLSCCSRLVRGGGPGASVPYRIYIDSGVVLMCTLALAPAAPIIAPAAVAYFLFLQPLLIRNLIFMYRPRFDGGGFRWPFIFDMCMSATYVAIILLTVQMALKQAAGPAAAAAVTILPIYFFQKSAKLRFLRAFEDAGLLQTSLLDGWDTAAEYSMEKREEFRRFLVDAHKAAYVSLFRRSLNLLSMRCHSQLIVFDVRLCRFPSAWPAVTRIAF